MKRFLILLTFLPMLAFAEPDARDFVSLERSVDSWVLLGKKESWQAFRANNSEHTPVIGLTFGEVNIQTHEAHTREVQMAVEYCWGYWKDPSNYPGNFRYKLDGEEHWHYETMYNHPVMKEESIFLCDHLRDIQKKMGVYTGGK
ncbi:hypothetical protein [Herbaspirillum sp.]|uniref:hypothetical protein n=1 Tax=Herbaspirillum sp. TaxID=1890675 RepID=UPI0025BE5650|nr:hypothetical protein [Herbaspirillum sp.]